MITPLSAQTTILGELTFKGASKVEKTSGVWIDGKYVGYLGELWGPKRILLIPGDHDLTVRQAGYKDFTEKLTVEPKELLLVPVKMEKEANDKWPTVTGELKVDVNPDRAAVFVYDRFWGMRASWAVHFTPCCSVPEHIKSRLNCLDTRAMRRL